MFHAISAAWGRLARPIRSRLARDRELATWYGWQSRRLGYGRWEFRDPRFGHLAAAATALAPTPRTWAQAAIADRIDTLGIGALATAGRCPSCRGTGEQYYQARDGAFVLAACDICGNGRVGSKGTGVLGGLR